jgi:hypothetical protein
MVRQKRVEPAHVNVLRDVPPENAFYFYEGIGQPIGLASRNLVEFRDQTKAASPRSIEFHLERGDFENWFRMLGDESLSHQVANLRKRRPAAEQLPSRLSSLVDSRIRQLRRSG